MHWRQETLKVDFACLNCYLNATKGSRQSNALWSEGRAALWTSKNGWKYYWRTLITTGHRVVVRHKKIVFYHNKSRRHVARPVENLTLLTAICCWMHLLEYVLHQKRVLKIGLDSFVAAKKGNVIASDGQYFVWYYCTWFSKKNSN